MWSWIQLHPLAADGALAGALLGAALVSSHATVGYLKVADRSFRAPDAVGVAAGLAALVAPLVLRRRFPLNRGPSAEVLSLDRASNGPAGDDRRGRWSQNDLTESLRRREEQR